MKLTRLELRQLELGILKRVETISVAYAAMTEHGGHKERHDALVSELLDFICLYIERAERCEKTS